jgi:DNA-binding NtrC family response regulator
VTSGPTQPSSPLPWGGEDDAADVAAWTLVILWSLAEPWRVGESVSVLGPAVLGRGPSTPDDAAPRLAFGPARPGRPTEGAPLEGERISRIQLRVLPEATGLEIRSLGRCTLSIGGRETTSARAVEGDVLSLRNALLLLVTRRASGSLPDAGDGSFPFGNADPDGIVGESAAAWSLRASLRFAARAGGHVLVTGESGTGKELAARSLHRRSSRARGPFVARNASTFPEALMDAEVFGSAKNYPQSGMPERPGLVGEASGGTLFFDEIGELPATLQAHLLRVLDRDGEYQRLGEATVRRADVRIVGATNRDPAALKHDLLARFPLRVEVPSLNARREDVPLLVPHLLRAAMQRDPALERFFEETGGRLHPRIDPLLTEALTRHVYRLHARELERLLWIALATSGDRFLRLTPQVVEALGDATEDVPRAATTSVDAAATSGEASAALDESAIREALRASNGSVTAAARALGLKNRFVLYRTMKKLGIEPPEGGD